ncbi:glycogen synthase [Patescibacteria group bacterium]|nr:glycogen synthase [Patescibacteria group bacterium]MBU1891132.1 glycogen synthase [Patescibacteria group bacterium]
MNNSIKVLFATAELNPIAKVGGLADVAGALPPILHELGVDIRVVMPKYGIIDENKYPCKKIHSDIDVTIDNNTEKIDIYETKIPDTEVIVYLIDNHKYLGQNGVYFDKTAFVDSIGEVHRFLFFSKAILPIFSSLNWYPDVLHCQDWHVGILPALLNLEETKQPELEKIKTLFTVHNLANQGSWEKSEILDFLGLSDDNIPSLAVNPKDINLIQQGIMNADLINTVSRTYAKEILTPEYGEGLEGDLAKRKDVLFGIVNGIDQKRFNPSTDPDIAANFSLQNIDQKMVNKKDIQKICGLKVDEKIPLLGIITRLTNQKGIELVADSAETIVKAGGQLILLGTGADNYEKMMTELQAKYPENVHAHIAFDAVLAQKIYAGSDVFLMPSRFEPCGLGQLIAMRYGTLPIVRATGGLKDTVPDYNPDDHTGTGFVFDEYTSASFVKSVKRALDVYKNDPDNWNKLVKSALEYDSSWDTAAKEYLELYKKLIK